MSDFRPLPLPLPRARRMVRMQERLDTGSADDGGQR